MEKLLSTNNALLAGILVLGIGWAIKQPWLYQQYAAWVYPLVFVAVGCNIFLVFFFLKLVADFMEKRRNNKNNANNNN